MEHTGLAEHRFVLLVESRHSRLTWPAEKIGCSRPLEVMSLKKGWAQWSTACLPCGNDWDDPSDGNGSAECRFEGVLERTLVFLSVSGQCDMATL